MSKWGYKKEIETSKVCGANGECISDNLSDYRCSCHPGFTGEYCEISKEKSSMENQTGNFKKNF